MRRRVAIVCLTGIVALLLAACGLPQDKEPQRFGLPAAAEQALKQASSTTTSPAVARPEDLYYVSGDTDDEKLVPVRTPIRESGTLNDEARAVLEGLKTVPADRRAELRTSLGENTRINSVSVNETGVAKVDLVLGVSSTSARLAAAQIVFALTDLDGIQGVSFFLNGEPSAPPTEVAVDPGEPVTRNHYPTFLEGVEQAVTTTVAPAPGG
jgi:spore germination protein GerM